MRDERGCVAEVKSANAFSNAMISENRSVMLPEVLGPRLDNEGLEITAWLGDIFEQPPAHGAIPPANATEFKHRQSEAPGLKGADPVLDCDQHRTLVRFRLIHRHRHGRSRCGLEINVIAKGNRKSTDGGESEGE